MKIWLTLFCIFALDGLGLQGQLNKASIALSGRVVDAGGDPISGAIVRIVPISKEAEPIILTTDKDGAFVVNRLADGLYSVEASNRGYLNVRYYPISVRFPKPTILEFSLPIGEITEGGVQFEVFISGTLEMNGKPIPNAQICLTKTISASSVQNKTCTDTNELGQYALSVSPGTYMARVIQRQKELLNRRVSFSSPGDYRNPIQLELPRNTKQNKGNLGRPLNN